MIFKIIIILIIIAFFAKSIFKNTRFIHPHPFRQDSYSLIEDYEDVFADDEVSDDSHIKNLSSLIGLPKPEPTITVVRNEINKGHVETATRTLKEAINRNVDSVIQSKTVLIVGAGGRVGSFLTYTLAPYVGKLIINEPDHVMATDLTFLSLYDASAVGSLKVDALLEKLLSDFSSLEIDSDVCDAEHCGHLSRFIDESDLVVMAADTVPALRRICLLATKRKPVLWPSVAGDNKSMQFVLSTPPGPCLSCIIGLNPGEELTRGQGRNLEPMKARLASISGAALAIEVLSGHIPHPAGHPLLFQPFTSLPLVNFMEATWLSASSDPRCPFCGR